MRPPEALNVIDSHGGFTAQTTPLEDTLWRPGSILRHSTEGKLISFDERSFYQTNNDVTKALYKVRGYCCPVVCWFDNATSERIA